MPVRAGGVLELYDGLTLCGECDARVLLEALAVHVRMAELVRVIHDGTVPRKPLSPPAPARGAVSAERKAELRETRKSRRKSMNGRMILSVALALAVGGCLAAPNTPESRAVRVVEGGDLTAVQGCTPLKQMVATSLLTGMSSAIGQQNNRYELIELTASAGGNVLVTTDTGDGYHWSSPTAYGTAYRCP
jgi:CO/xanthine dehydrogenase Mo-binding subunit